MGKQTDMSRHILASHLLMRCCLILDVKERLGIGSLESRSLFGARHLLSRSEIVHSLIHRCNKRLQRLQKN